VANGIYQNTVYGLAAKLPFKFTGAVVLGSVSNTFNILKFIIREPIRYLSKKKSFKDFTISAIKIMVVFEQNILVQINVFFTLTTQLYN